jgi:hypothetical protein
MTALTRREQVLLLDTIGPGWMLTWMLLDDAGIDHVRASWLGGHVRSLRSGIADDGRTFFQVGKRGVAIGKIEPEPAGFVAAETITWASIRAHRASVPAPVMAEIAAARRASAEHAYTSYPRFEPPADPAAYSDAYFEHQREFAEPWYAESNRLTRALAAAVLCAFPLAAAPVPDGEPLDLLALLAQLEAVPA